ITLTYDANTGTVVAAWGDLISFAAYYSIYNGTSWTTAATIPLGASSGVFGNLALTYDANTGTVVAAWDNISTAAAYYSIYNGISNTCQWSKVNNQQVDCRIRIPR